MLAFVLVLGSVCGLFCVNYASEKNRNIPGWFVVGFCFGLIGVLIAAAASPLPEVRP